MQNEIILEGYEVRWQNFYTKVYEVMVLRIMGLDVGEKRIGVALSDPYGWTAQGLTTVIRQEGSNKDIDEIKKLINEYQVEKIIIGLPKNMNSSLGPAAEKAMKYGQLLQKRCNIPVDYFDERLTTVAAHKTLIEADMPRKKRKGVVDKLAAVFILQTYLDQNSKL